MKWKGFLFVVLIHLALKSLAIYLLWLLLAPLVDAKPMSIWLAILVALASMLFSLRIEIKEK